MKKRAQQTGCNIPLLQARVRDLVREWMEKSAVGHPDEITVPWLMEMHSELDAEEAEEYRLFLKVNTVYYRGCYGDGSIMWPQWQALKAEIKAL